MIITKKHGVLDPSRSYCSGNDTVNIRELKINSNFYNKIQKLKFVFFNLRTTVLILIITDMYSSNYIKNTAAL